MNAAFLLAVVSALLAFALGVTVALREKVSLASMSFFAGMTVLAAESLLGGLAAQSTSLDEV
ncbi:MAG TPA: hypothetical protein VMP11_18135, partial [Verrucomicrobiae bacterium]|nr:hypothetical protein [Verrucomicrobiae bacterium]